MNRNTPGLPVHHQPPEFTQTHVHWISDAIQPSHPLLFPSPPAPNPSQHQGLFQWGANSKFPLPGWPKSFLVQGSEDLSPVYFRVQLLQSSLELSWEILSPETILVVFIRMTLICSPEYVSRISQGLTDLLGVSHFLPCLDSWVGKPSIKSWYLGMRAHSITG